MVYLRRCLEQQPGGMDGLGPGVCIGVGWASLGLLATTHECYDPVAMHGTNMKESMNESMNAGV